MSFPYPLDPAGRIARFYDSIAQEYDTAYGGPVERAEDVALGWLLRHSGFNDPSRIVVDLGCGTGLFLRLCPQHRGHPWRYTGVDLSEGMLAQARLAHPGNVFARAEMVGYARRHVRTVNQVASLWGAASYVPPADMVDALRYLLAGGGEFFVMTLAAGKEPALHTEGLPLYDYTAFPEMLRNHGFAVRSRSFAREWRVPWPLGVAVEVLGSLLPPGRGRHRYVIHQGRRL